MQPLQAIPAASPLAGFGAAFKRMADELCGTLARLIAYLCALALLFIFGVWLWGEAQGIYSEPPARPEWTAAARPVSAFASNQYDFQYKTRSYHVLRHAEGGRRDILRWSGADGRPIAELEIYRPGGEIESAVPFETMGTVDSKFGPVALLRRTEEGCLGFLKAIDRPFLRISGFVCQDETLPAQSAAVACLLNRLSLVAAGNDARLAELFARADLKRAECRTDWVSGSGRPALRGAI
jgi:hypothetical protein